jgi:hypothetical protein
MPAPAPRAVIILVAALLPISCGGKHPRLTFPRAFQPHSLVGGPPRSSSPTERKPLSHGHAEETSAPAGGSTGSASDRSETPAPSSDRQSAPSWSVTMIRTPDAPVVTPHAQPPQSSTGGSPTRSIGLSRGWGRFIGLALVAAGVIFLIALLTRHRITPG